jgi:hypothetical protein
VVYSLGHFIFILCLLEDPRIFRPFKDDSFQGDISVGLVVGCQIDCAAGTGSDAFFYGKTANIEYIFSHITKNPEFSNLWIFHYLFVRCAEQAFCSVNFAFF